MGHYSGVEGRVLQAWQAQRWVKVVLGREANVEGGEQHKRQGKEGLQ